MQNFIVSARKYRPQTFSTVVGQPSITSTLKNAILHNQLAQAFLFCGPRGVGKTTCARILAKTINCENLSPEGEACDACPSCVSFNENASFNIYELDGASNNSVDDIRSLVDQVRIPPQMGKYKVYIIDEVHMLSASAFNAFLKTLEEPPAYAKFILATTEKHKILPTILSRCQIFDFRRITVDDIAAHLQYVAGQEQINASEDALHIIAQKADGAMRDALSIFDQLVSFAGHELTYETVLENLNVLDYEYYFGITGMILGNNVAGVLLILNEILEKGFDGQHFLIGFGEHIRNLLVCKDAATVKLLETAPNIRQRYQEQAAVCSPDLLLKILDINNRCDLNYRISNNKRLHLELALMQMCTLNQEKKSADPGSRTETKRSSAEPIPDPGLHKAKASAAPAPAPTPAPQPPPSSSSSPSSSPTKPKDYGDHPTGTISIKAGVKPDAKTEVADESAEKNRPASSFSEEELKIHWEAFAAGLTTDFPHLATTLTSRKPSLKEEWTIEFEVDNRILEEELNQKRSELLEFLRRTLDNYQITLQTRIQENAVERKPYTDKEKFEKMAEKNPALNKLKEQLDLDIEY
ncbi:MAG: DNA polymerase III subunit gamma/tau [Bacteroidales bacterium]|nr:DNA polymerase III subunit gamma/tau [Bacteroidales bacterium]